MSRLPEDVTLVTGRAGVCTCWLADHSHSCRSTPSTLNINAVGQYKSLSNQSTRVQVASAVMGALVAHVVCI